MKLRNKTTGKIVELDHFSMHYNRPEEWGVQPCSTWNHSLAELNEEWEDYTPKEPLIKDKDEEARKAIRAFSEAIHEKKILVVKQFGRGSVQFSCGATFWIKLPLSYETMDALEDGTYYTIAELCGEEEE